MNQQAKIILLTGLALMAAAVLLLQRLQAGQRLGPPGVQVVAGQLHDTNGAVMATRIVFLPEKILDLTSRPLPLSKVECDWLPRDTTYGRRRYAATNRFSVDVGVVLMGRDRTSIHQPQYCLVGQGWRIDGSENDRIPIARPIAYELPVKKLSMSYPVKRPDGGVQVWRGYFVYWFVADDQLTTEHKQRMWWMARDLIRRGVLQRWAYVSYFVAFQAGQDRAAYDQVKAMIAASVPEFQVTPSGEAVATRAASSAGGAVSP